MRRRPDGPAAEHWRRVVKAARQVQLLYNGALAASKVEQTVDPIRAAVCMTAKLQKSGTDRVFCLSPSAFRSVLNSCPTTV